MSEEFTSAHSSSSESAIFVHSKLDDFGLTASQFRVLCHVARRAGQHTCYASVPTMALVCRLEQKTVRQAIKFLEDRNILSIARKHGCTNVIKILPLGEWKEEPPPNGTRGAKRVGTLPKRHHHTPPKRHQGHPTQTAPDEGNPSEGIPIKEIPKKGGKAPKLFPKELIAKLKALAGQKEIYKYDRLDAYSYRDGDGKLLPEYQDNINAIESAERELYEQLTGVPLPAGAKVPKVDAASFSSAGKKLDRNRGTYNDPSDYARHPDTF